MRQPTEIVRVFLEKDLDGLRALLARGVDPDRAEDGGPILPRAIGMPPEEGMPFFEALIAAGARVDRRDGAGWLPLEKAVWGGNEPAVRRLLELGADPHATPGSRVDILEYAVVEGRRGIIAALLPHYRPPFAPTLLCLAAGHGHNDAVTLLLEAGAEPDAKSSHGHTPLLAALDPYDREQPPGEPAIVSVVETLLAAGADPKRRDADGHDALALARTLGYPSVLKLIEEFTS